jgi:hypothetical protein
MIKTEGSHYQSTLQKNAERNPIPKEEHKHNHENTGKNKFH